MKSIDDLIAERYERLAFIGADDRCPGTHAPAVSGTCPACAANRVRAFLRTAVEKAFREAVSANHADYGRDVMRHPLPPVPPVGRVTSEHTTYPPAPSGSGGTPPSWKHTPTPASIKNKEVEFRQRVFADNSLSMLGKLAIISGYNPYPGSPYFPDDQKEHE